MMGCLGECRNRGRHRSRSSRAIAMPSAMPSSYAVSETAAAAPTRSFGTLAMMTSLATVNANPETDADDAQESCREMRIRGDGGCSGISDANRDADQRQPGGQHHCVATSSPRPRPPALRRSSRQPPRAARPARLSTGCSPGPAGRTATGRTAQPERPSTDSRLAATTPENAAIAEQPNIDQRDRQPQLSPYEQHQRGRPDNARRDDVDMQAARRPLLDGVDDAEHAQHRQADTRQIPRAGLEDFDAQAAARCRPPAGPP